MPTALPRYCTAVIATLLCAGVHASPLDGDDDLSRLLQDRGLIEVFAASAPRATGPRNTANVPNSIRPALTPDPIAEVTTPAIPVKSQHLPANGRANELLVHAMGFLDIPYQWGGTTAETGFDCSGFVQAMFDQAVGVVLPRQADKQAQATEAIPMSDLQPGDLVFFNTLSRPHSHVGIYIGDNRFIHSPSTGSRVKMAELKESYWKTRLDGLRRVSVAALAYLED